MNAIVVGTGKMGTHVERLLAEAGHRVVARVSRQGDGSGRTLGDALAASKPDVAIEFTAPTSAAANLTTLVRANVPTVSGTTGWDTAPVAALANEMGTPVLVAANFSIGVAVMKSAVRQIARLLQPFADFEPGIVERHHNQKKDAPSGTARMLAEQIAANSGGREVPVTALRQGSQPGEHTVFFEGALECLTITHQVRCRSVFALGAVRAAEWLAREKPRGWVTFEQFLERTESWTQD